MGGCHAHGEEQIVGERWVVIAGELDGVGAEIHPVDVVPAIWEAFGNANKAVTSAANAKWRAIPPPGWINQT